MVKRLILFVVLILLAVAIFHYRHNQKIRTYPRVLFLGDQIVRGINDPSEFGFRDHVQTLLAPGRWNFVGPFANPIYNRSFSVNHAGEDWNWAGLARARTERLLEKYFDPEAKSDWILIYVGTIDILKGINREATKMDLKGLIKDITDFNPYIRIVLAKSSHAGSEYITKKSKFSMTGWKKWSGREPKKERK